MNFRDARRQLQAIFGNRLGRTAEAGRWFNRAVNMRFQQHPHLPNVLEAIGNPGMWLYYSPVKSRICCGDKDYMPSWAV